MQKNLELFLHLMGEFLKVFKQGMGLVRCVFQEYHSVGKEENIKVGTIAKEWR